MRRVASWPAEGIFSQVADRGIVDGDAAFGHHLLEISEAEIIGQYQRTQSRITDRSKCLPLNTLTSILEPGEH